MPRPKSKNPNTAKVNYMVTEETKQFMAEIAEFFGVSESDLHRHIVGHVMCSFLQHPKLMNIAKKKVLESNSDVEGIEELQHHIFQFNQRNFRSMLNPLLPIVNI